MRVVLAVALVGLAVGAWLFIRSDRMLAQPRLLAQQIAETSPMINERLSGPLHFGRMSEAKLHDDGNAYLAIGLSGPADRGTLVEWAQQNAGHWRVCSLVYHSSYKATKIELVRASESGCSHD